MTDTADVVVIGMGPGGEEVAGRLAEAGLDVVGIDKKLLGGECPYWGCIPSKMMIRAADLLAEGRRIPGLAGASTVTPDWAPVAARIREATDNWDDRVAVERFEDKGGRFVRGEARLIGPGQVQVGDRVIQAGRAVVLATGTMAAVPPIDGLAGTPYWINRDIIECEILPASLTVLGGGAIGVELSQVFARFGVHVTIVEAAPRILPLEEPEVSSLITGVLTSEGIDVVAGTGAQSVRFDQNRFTVTLGDGRAVESEKLLVATGRRADIRAVGVASIGIDDSQRWVPVDDRLRVTDGVWAVGDLTGAGAFTHVSMYQAGIAVADILGHDLTPADYRALPRVTFTDPEAGSVGLSEAAAREQGLNVLTGTSQIPESARGWIHKAGNEGFIKLVADADRDVLVGATSVGPTGGEVLSMLTLAVHAQISIGVLRSMIYAYPTFHRAVEAALQAMTSGSS